MAFALNSGSPHRAARAAEVNGQHEGHWSLHHIALPREMPGDFTRIPVPEYAEEELSRSVGCLSTWPGHSAWTAPR